MKQQLPLITCQYKPMHVRSDERHVHSARSHYMPDCLPLHPMLLSTSRCNAGCIAGSRQSARVPGSQAGHDLNECSTSRHMSGACQDFPASQQRTVRATASRQQLQVSESTATTKAVWSSLPAAIGFMLDSSPAFRFNESPGFKFLINSCRHCWCQRPTECSTRATRCYFALSQLATKQRHCHVHCCRCSADSSFAPEALVKGNQAQSAPAFTGSRSPAPQRQVSAARPTSAAGFGQLPAPNSTSLAVTCRLISAAHSAATARSASLAS